MNITSNYKPFEKKFTYYCVGNIMDSESDAKILKPLFTKILDFIHNAIMDNKKVLVHCAAGISRSSTVVIGYLMCKWKLELKHAFKICREKRPGVWPNSGFLEMLISIEKEMFGKSSLKRDTWNIEEC